MAAPFTAPITRRGKFASAVATSVRRRGDGARSISRRSRPAQKARPAPVTDEDAHAVVLRERVERAHQGAPQRERQGVHRLRAVQREAGAAVLRAGEQQDVGVRCRVFMACQCWGQAGPGHRRNGRIRRPCPLTLETRARIGTIAALSSLNPLRERRSVPPWTSASPGPARSAGTNAPLHCRGGDAARIRPRAGFARPRRGAARRAGGSAHAALVCSRRTREGARRAGPVARRQGHRVRGGGLLAARPVALNIHAPDEGNVH